MVMTDSRQEIGSHEIDLDDNSLTTLRLQRAPMLAAMQCADTIKVTARLDRQFGEA